MAKREHSYNSGRIYRAGQSDSQPRQAVATGGGNAQRASAPRRKVRSTGPPAYAVGAGYKSGSARTKPRGRKRWPFVVLIIVIVLAIAAGIFLLYLDRVIDPGDTGTITTNNPAVKEKEGKDVYNLLLVGIDYEGGRETQNTDMILYVRLDVKNGKASMLQIPRDSYVGSLTEAGSEGKINGLLANGPDRDNPINNLASMVEEQFHLPVDNYISVDMEGFVSIVDALGGVWVNVPRDMQYEGAFLGAGYKCLTGTDVEFFVRNRSGEGFARGDPDRLINQRLFYAGLFKRMKEMSAGDLVSLLPSIESYINTDYSAVDLLGLAQALRGIPSENIVFCMAPGATTVLGVWNADPEGSRSVYQLDWYGRQIWQPSDDPENTEGGSMVADPENPGIANLLNQYFRADGSIVTADELGPQDENDLAYHRVIPENVTLYASNVQVMSGVGEAGEPAAE